MPAPSPEPLSDPVRSPQVAVGAVVVRDGRLLLIRRGRGVGAGRWSLPGGRVQHGESLAGALEREMREETGLDVDVGPLCGIAERRIEDAHFVILDYWCRVGPDAVATAGDDAADVRWVSRDDLDTLDLVPGLIAFLSRHGVLAHLR